MKMQQRFRVNSDPDTVWAYFQDIRAVAECLPGAELTARLDDNTYQGKITTKLGPVTATFEGEAVIESEPTSRSGTMQGKGVDKKGGSRGEITVEYALQPEGATTLVDLDANVRLSGAAARFGRAALLEEVTRRLLEDFTGCVEARLVAAAAGLDSASGGGDAGDSSPTELRGVSLLLKSLVGTATTALKKSVDRIRARLRRTSE